MKARFYSSCGCVCSTAAVRASILYRKWLLRQCSIVCCEALRLSATLSPFCNQEAEGRRCCLCFPFPPSSVFPTCVGAMGKKRAPAVEPCLPLIRARQDSSVRRYGRLQMLCFHASLFVQKPPSGCVSPLPLPLSLLSQQKSILLHSVCQHFSNYAKFLLLLVLYLLFSLHINHSAAWRGAHGPLFLKAFFFFLG